MFPAETDGSRTVEPDRAKTDLLPKVSGKLAYSLEHVTRAFADRLRRQFAQEIGNDPRAFKKRVLRLIRRQLPPGRGRPRDPKTEAALELLRQGKTVRQALRVQVRGFEQLDTWGRMLAEKALRQAISRKRRHAEETWQRSKSR